MPLVFVDRTIPGVAREPHGDGFRYISARGRLVNDPRALKRIAALAIPPAWRQVWIAPSASAHIQATGYDAKGRLQYLYHPQFRQSQEAAKFSRLLAFVQALPRLREAVARDMSLTGLRRERALATLTYLLETTLIRIGNSAYARANDSYGLSTLTPEHLVLQGTTLTFEFTGKSGKKWLVTIRDRRAAAVMRACQELPGQKLFRYVDEAGVAHGVTSADVNAYLKSASGRRISAKDFRTWGGTLLCALALAAEPPAESERGRKRQIAAAMRETAKALGNTAAVCRASYVHPGVLAAHGSGDLHRRLAKLEAGQAAPGRLKPHEDAVLRMLRRLERAAAKTRGVVSLTAVSLTSAAPPPAP
jgi:DNA topoisomerase I